MAWRYRYWPAPGPATPFPCNRPRDRLPPDQRGRSRMRRREFIAGLGSAAAWPVVALAQQAAAPVIGWISAVPGTMERALPAFSQGLAEAGYVVGRNVTIDASGDHVDQQAAIAAELVRRHVAVIVAAGRNAALAAKAATQTIP